MIKIPIKTTNKLKKIVHSLEDLFGFKPIVSNNMVYIPSYYYEHKDETEITLEFNGFEGIKFVAIYSRKYVDPNKMKQWLTLALFGKAPDLKEFITIHPEKEILKAWDKIPRQLVDEIEGYEDLVVEDGDYNFVDYFSDIDFDYKPEDIIFLPKDNVIKHLTKLRSIIAFNEGFLNDTTIYLLKYVYFRKHMYVSYKGNPIDLYKDYTATIEFPEETLATIKDTLDLNPRFSKKDVDKINNLIVLLNKKPITIKKLNKALDHIERYTKSTKAFSY